MGFAVKLGSSIIDSSESCWFLSYFAQKNVVVCPRPSYVVFSITFLRTGFSLSSYVNCAFNPLSYRKHVLPCWQWNLMFRAFCCKKTAILFFVSEYPFSIFLVAKIRFFYVGNKVPLLWVLYHKKSVYAENFFLFNKPEFKFYGKQIKTCILCYKAEYNVFSNEKEKGCFLWSKFQSSPILLQTNQNMFFIR